MTRFVARLAAVLVGITLVTIALPARADDDAVDRAADQLKNGDDFRVRTQAALSLGASKSKRAVEPLCGGLEDSNTTVRSAAAAALGKRKKGGKDCLEKRLGDESSENVKTSIKKALASLKGGGAAITSSTKYYVVVAKVADKTGRSGSEVHDMVHAAMSKAAGKLDGYVVAPADESMSDSRKKLAKWPSLKAFYLAPKVFEPRYSGGSLTVKIDVALFSFPAKVLKGNIPVKLTQDDVSDKDASSENDLIKMASERAMEKFSQNVERIQ